jgi:adenosylcobinamide-GDP ribazoletransferase
MRTLIAAVRFLSRVPVPGPATRGADLPGALGWFPLVGALVGAGIGGAFVGLSLAFPAPVAAVLAVALGLLITGAFHEDAVADSADALGCGARGERAREIMKDPRIGSYAAVTLWCLLAFRAAALIALGATAWLALALACAWGRWTAAPLIRALPALGGGLGKDIAAAPGAGALALATLLALGVTALAWWLGCARAPWAALAALVATLLWALYLRRRLGGQCGDLLGAGNQAVEAAVLLVLVAQ